MAKGNWYSSTRILLFIVSFLYIIAIYVLSIIRSAHRVPEIAGFWWFLPVCTEVFFLDQCLCAFKPQVFKVL